MTAAVQTTPNLTSRFINGILAIQPIANLAVLRPGGYLAILEQAIVQAGFLAPTITCNSPRHRTVIVQVSG